MKRHIVLTVAIYLGLASPAVNATTAEELGAIGAFWISVFSPNYTHTTNATTTLYKTDQPPSVNLAREALPYMELSEHVYQSHGAPSGWQLREIIQDQSIGFHLAVYIQANKAVVALRGSEVGSSDWVNDGLLSIGYVPPQFETVIRESAYLANKYSGYNVSFTGHSLGGGLATAAAIRTGKPAIVFDATGVNKAVIKEIKNAIESDGYPRSKWRDNAKGIINYNLEGEFVSDMDLQQDADTAGTTTQQYGTIFYLSSDRFLPLPIARNSFTMHFTVPLKEELQFLAEPFYRRDIYDHNSIDNDIDGVRSLVYFDWTDDTADVIFFLINYAGSSLASLNADIFEK
ncbi:phospholipase [Grimontia kaedaensis]|uniref:Phospholipase n=1 Tax=Grimontia kaedaensis TaxID=2872157 RepID=A0ABY4WXC7_9GAMM|nr:phospholipase [Grimontia kaedaensis]USH03637.1 phospholipase [Grimontia kaedaensis]